MCIFSLSSILALKHSIYDTIFLVFWFFSIFGIHLEQQGKRSEPLQVRQIEQIDYARHEKEITLLKIQFFDKLSGAVMTATQMLHASLFLVW